MSAPAGQPVAWQGITPRTPLPRNPGTTAALGLGYKGVAPNLSGRDKLYVPTPLNPAAESYVPPAPRGGRTRRMRKAKRSKKSKRRY
jgi:hypothetical protein